MNDAEKIAILTEALVLIVEWELPPSQHYWDKEKTKPMSYSAAYGSNGERDYMRNIARSAIQDTSCQQH